MLIGGFQRFTLIDYPGKISAVIFTQGCNLACGFCHNPELVDPSLYREPISEKTVLDFLEFRRKNNQLDAVVLTGGEPTLQNDLIKFLIKLKKMKYSVKLDTNGTNPDILRSIISDKLVDFIAMDIKAPFEKYSKIAGVKIDVNCIIESISCIQSSTIEHEFRTTVINTLLDEKDIFKIHKSINNSPFYRLQPFTNEVKLFDGRLSAPEYKGKEQDLENIRYKLNNKS